MCLALLFQGLSSSISNPINEQFCDQWSEKAEEGTNICGRKLMILEMMA